MPARVGGDSGADTFGQQYKIWQRFEFGDLVDLVLTDERLYRDPPRNADSLLPTWLPLARGREAPERSMLGTEQREWFLDRIQDSAATWTVWSDEVLTLPFKVGAGPLTVHPSESGWDGYGRERRLITETLGESDTENFVTLTGDMHCYIAGYQRTEYRDALSGVLGRLRAAVGRSGTGGPPADSNATDPNVDGSIPDDGDPRDRVGVEFMTPATTSVSVTEALGINGGVRERFGRVLSRAVRAQNPHLTFFDSSHWGYSVVEFTPEACTYTGYSVDKTENSPDAEKEPLVALRVPEGRVEIERLPADPRS